MRRSFRYKRALHIAQALDDPAVGPSPACQVVKNYPAVVRHGKRMTDEPPKVTGRGAGITRIETV